MTTIHMDLLGTETKFYDTGKYVTRAIEVRTDKTPLILLHGGGGHAESTAGEGSMASSPRVGG